MDYSNYEKLRVWEQSHKLVLKIYKDTDNFPKNELLGLTSQIRRAASSIPTNIAEGTGTKTKATFCRYLFIARGSLMETRYLLRLSKDLGYLEKDVYKQYEDSYHDIGRMLNGLINSLSTK